MVSLHVQIPRTLRDELDALAESEQEALAVVVRRVLRQGLAAETQRKHEP